MQKNNIGHTIEGDSLEMDLFENETPVEEDIDFDEPDTTEKNENGDSDHDHGLRTHYCLVLLQVPKCFGRLQIFCARLKIYLHIVAVTNLLCQTKR